MRWPLPAVLTWAACWLLLRGLLGQGVAPAWAVLASVALGGAASLAARSWWRRLWVALGFPLSLLVLLPGVAVLPAWVWLLPLGLLLVLYPVKAWSDAPLFPTPRRALLAAPQYAPLAAGARVLDAGCGLGHGLVALRLAYPQAQLHGLEWSWPLRWLCALRCPWARVRQGDMWAADWSGYAMVYLFQRPESMPRALAKAQAELPAGAYLVSLAFAIPQCKPHAQWALPGGRMVWIYQAPLIVLAGE